MARSWAQRVLDAAEVYRDAECALTIARAAAKTARDRAAQAEETAWKCQEAAGAASERLRETARQPDTRPQGEA